MKLNIAVLSDIHGNIWALNEVLNDIRSREISVIINLGDSLYGGLDPAGCADILMNHQIITVLGNEDAVLLEDNVDINIHSSYEFTISNLNSEHLGWLRSLKKTRRYQDEIFICHGTPDSYNKYLIEDVIKGYPVIRSNSQLVDLTCDINEKIILCGHSHLPNMVAISNKLIINPGSVGLQAYDDDTPNYHIMESGSPHARYSVLISDNGILTCENIMVQYDWNMASEMALKNGRSDWALWLKSGRVLS